MACSLFVLEILHSPLRGAQVRDQKSQASFAIAVMTEETIVATMSL
jgi:hypothetical protein